MFSAEEWESHPLSCGSLNPAAPVSFAIQTDKPIVVMSESLFSLLKDDEIEAVMAHELAHIRNSDTTLKALVTAVQDCATSRSNNPPGGSRIS